MLAVFIDLETTGLDPSKHCVIEIAFKILDVSTGEVKVSYQNIIKQSFSEWEKRDPISVEINGFTLEMLLEGKDPDVVSKEVIEIFERAGIQRCKSFFIGQNPAFDRGFFGQLVNIYTQQDLNWPYHWLDLASMYWALLVQETSTKNLPFPTELNLSKNSIAERYNIPPEAEPHRAMNGVDHLLLCYKRVVGLPCLFP